MSKWPMVKLGEVCTFLSGGTPSRRNAEYYQGDIPWVSSADISDQGVVSPRRFITNEAVANSATTIVPKGTILLVTRTGVGKVAIADLPLSFSQDITGMCIASQNLDERYLTSVLRNYAAPKLVSKARGATILGVNRKDVTNLEIPLPPLEEQKRIAGILEASARQLEKVQTALDSLRQMRSSLIEEYCATSEVTVNLDSLASVTGGLSLSGKRAVNPIECEYLRVANIQRNRFLIDDVKTIRCTEKELDRCLVDDGDILMLEANANLYEVGRAAIAETFGRQFVFQNHLFRIRPVGVSSIVLNALLESTFVRSQLLRVVKTTSGLNTMTINQARNLKVPQCAPAKNRRFDSQLELLSSQARNLESKQNLLRELHQSLATRAFAGEL